MVLSPLLTASASATLSLKAGSLPFFSEEPGLRGCMVVKCLLSLKVALLLNQNSGPATDQTLPLWLS